MNLLKPVVVQIQGYPPHHADPIPTEVAYTPRLLLIVRDFWAS